MNQYERRWQEFIKRAAGGFVEAAEARARAASLTRALKDAGLYDRAVAERWGPVEAEIALKRQRDGAGPMRIDEFRDHLGRGNRALDMWLPLSSGVKKKIRDMTQDDFDSWLVYEKQQRDESEMLESALNEPRRLH